MLPYTHSTHLSLVCLLGTSLIGLERITGPRVRLDIVYTATSCEDYVIDEEKLEVNGLAGGRPLMLVDIAVPRNVNDNRKVVSSHRCVHSLFSS
jgi:glutamyl-tRNA reductase